MPKATCTTQHRAVQCFAFPLGFRWLMDLAHAHTLSQILTAALPMHCMATRHNTATMDVSMRDNEQMTLPMENKATTDS